MLTGTSAVLSLELYALSRYSAYNCRRGETKDHMERLPLEVQTLYAEMLEQLSALEARRVIGSVPGTFVTKTVKGQAYYYFQHVGPGGTRRQLYIGRRDDALDAVVARYAASRQLLAADAAAIQRLSSALRAGGAIATDAGSARVLTAMAEAGVFHLGGVLVGTHAFMALGNVLGVRWREASLRTLDVDLAAGKDIDVALPHLPGTSIPDALDSLEMGFLPVPGLDPTSPSTSYKVRGQALRVDVLTPSVRHGAKPVHLARFATAAQALPYLDCIMEGPVRAAVIGGAGVMVNVPDPARFALHKLIVAGERPAATHTKREKDLRQASQVIEVLLADRPGDLGIAWEALELRGSGWVKRARAGVAVLADRAPSTAEAIRSALPGL
jgi:hypothetical protein